MTVVADRHRCIAAGMCVLTEPALFDQDDDGTVVLLGQPRSDAETDGARRAVHACPAGALTVEPS
jgi:ferredoxin